MNTTVVGRVAVRVLPETGGFKERLRRDLTKETAGVDAEVPVEANLDAEGLEQELRAKVKELKDRFEVQIRSTICNKSQHSRARLGRLFAQPMHG